MAILRVGRIQFRFILATNTSEIAGAIGPSIIRIDANLMRPVGESRITLGVRLVLFEAALGLHTAALVQRRTSSVARSVIGGEPTSFLSWKTTSPVHSSSGSSDAIAVLLTFYF
ncbi:MAG: hypothetical protein ACI9BW_003068 [Gammaproteobacteria bacterium]|jgi:hypothetical protein